MSELLPYLQTQLGHAEESEISNAVLVPLPYLRKLIAALEERERLRAENEQLREMAHHIKTTFRTGYGAGMDEVKRVPEAYGLTALKDYERLQAVIKRIDAVAERMYLPQPYARYQAELVKILSEPAAVNAALERRDV